MMLEFPHNKAKRMRRLKEIRKKREALAFRGCKITIDGVIHKPKGGK